MEMCEAGTAPLNLRRHSWVLEAIVVTASLVLSFLALVLVSLLAPLFELSPAVCESAAPCCAILLFLAM